MINFEDGTLVKGAYVIIDGAEYPVHMPEYSGNTPTSAENFNKMQEDLLPVGSVVSFAGPTIPQDWLECKGQAVSRTDYAELFSAIGTIWGTGDGSTTFNLPDLQGRVTVGKNEDDTDFDEVGKTGGEKEHTLTISEMPSHNHDFNKTNVATMAGSGANEMSQTEGGRTYELMGIKNTGGSQPHNNLQPYAIMNYIIKAK